MNCQYCDDTGSYECELCKGKGCGECGQTGREICIFCRDAMPCHVCDGEGCTECAGFGFYNQYEDWKNA